MTILSGLSPGSLLGGRTPPGRGPYPSVDEDRVPDLGSGVRRILLAHRESAGLTHRRARFDSSAGYVGPGRLLWSAGMWFPSILRDVGSLHARSIINPAVAQNRAFGDFDRHRTHGQATGLLVPEASEGP